MLAKSTSTTDASTTALAAGLVPADLTDRLRRLRDALLTGLIERDVAIRLALLSALAGEHLLLVGPPGTAKSVLARRLHLAFRDESYFERLLTKFTVPEELFGPLSIKGLEEDRYERHTDRYLPTASVAFLDEIFKANSAILNALLTLLNEREFDNGSQRTKTPLISVVGASNELAEGEELDALFDRFLLRLHVGPVSAKGFESLLALRGDDVPVIDAASRLSRDDLAAIQAAASTVEVPGDVIALLVELREWCAGQGLRVSDRRWRKIVKLLQVSALTNGRSKVSIWDAWLLQHCLWSEPEARDQVYDWYAARVGASAAMDASRLTKIVSAWEATLKRDQESQSQQRDEQGRLLYLRTEGQTTVDPKERAQQMRGNERLFLAPLHSSTDFHMYPQIQNRTNAGRGYTRAELDELFVSQYQRFAQWSQRAAYLSDETNWHLLPGEAPPLMEPTRHKPAYIADCIRQIDAVRDDVRAYKAELRQHVAALDADITTHLWVTREFVGPATASLRRTTSEVEVLIARLERVRQDFERLPRESDSRPAPAAPAKSNRHK